jgi:hypothetical protein
VALGDRGVRTAFLAGLAAGIPAVALLPWFFRVIEARPGMVPPDPLLAAIPAVEVAVTTFLVLYLGIAAALWALFRAPLALLRALHAYVLLLLLRMVTMFVFTLEPPHGIIPLVDPVTAVFYPGGEPFLKDLFFSGHTATPVLLALAVGGGALRRALFVCAAVVGALVLVQHVHWTVDVLAAPLFAWLAWRASAVTLRWCGAAVSDAAAA